MHVIILFSRPQSLIGCHLFSIVGCPYPGQNLKEKNSAWAGSSEVIRFSPAQPQIRGIKETNQAYFWHSKTKKLTHPSIALITVSFILWLTQKHNLTNQNYTKYCTIMYTLYVYAVYFTDKLSPLLKFQNPNQMLGRRKHNVNTKWWNEIVWTTSFGHFMLLYGFIRA